VSFRDFFSETYAEARAKFLAECPDATAWETDALGPNGETLAVDTAWFGPADAAKVAVLISGTHGVEGLAGAGCQIGWLRSGGPASLPEGVAVLLVHLLNPYGAAYVQRETEETVDLNRNYVDHDAPYADNALYEKLHAVLVAPDRETAEAPIAAFRKEHGTQGYAQALFGGQYSHPDGMHFGGAAPTWSNRTLCAIAERYLTKAREVSLLDYHTGLGSWAFATLVAFVDPTDPSAVAAKATHGPSVLAVGPVVAGHTAYGLKRMLPASTGFRALTVEYGTDDVETECQVVRDALWLRLHGDPASPEGRRIKAALLEYFYPASWNWRELVWRRSEQIIRDSLGALA
jgi:hypothetical protein